MIFILAIFVTLETFAMNPNAIIEKADNVRNPGDSYFMKVRVEDSDKRTSIFEVSLSGNDKTHVKTVEPARDRGRNLLMIGEEMWASIPNLKRAVRVALNQKLTGQAANGDISRMRWSGDYDAQIETETPQHWELLLTAKKKGLTYDKIRVKIQKNTFRPLEAQFLTPNLKLLKVAKYTSYKMLAGMERPTLIHIEDATNSTDSSDIHIEEMKPQKFPGTLFHQASFQ